MSEPNQEFLHQFYYTSMGYLIMNQESRIQYKLFSQYHQYFGKILTNIKKLTKQHKDLSFNQQGYLNNFLKSLKDYILNFVFTGKINTLAEFEAEVHRYSQQVNKQGYQIFLRKLEGIESNIKPQSTKYQKYVEKIEEKRETKKYQKVFIQTQQDFPILKKTEEIKYEDQSDTVSSKSENVSMH